MFLFIICSIIGLIITAFFISYSMELCGIKLRGTSFYERFTNQPHDAEGNTEFAHLKPGEDPIPTKPEELLGYEYKPGSMFQLANIQGTKHKRNWCRVVRNIENHGDEFVTCSLAGSHNKYPYWFKSANKNEGFLVGRHGYMKDITDNGIDSYCRIVSLDMLSTDYGEAPTWEVKCNPTEGLEMTNKMITDPSPPDNIIELLKHYEGCIAWFPWNTENMNEYIRNHRVNNNGGVIYNADKNQYIWNGVKSSLSMYENIKWNRVRTICCWVKMNENNNESLGDLTGTAEESTGMKYFPRWSKIFDFYTAPFENHFFLGNEDITSNLIMECWHEGSRAMRIKVPKVFEAGKWVHICLTTESLSTENPTWLIYKNGKQIKKHENGKLPSKIATRSHNFGKSGDSDDEFFAGSIRDLRFYEIPFDSGDIARTMNYLKPTK